MENNLGATVIDVRRDDAGLPCQTARMLLANFLHGFPRPVSSEW